jgi:tRNA A-37 threonylcarbamoyl transferase component Bud32
MIDRVVGNYRIVEKLGEGGMGAVYRAVDLLLEREVAIKAIRPELSRDPEIVERFRAEAKMLARVSHPAIATIYSFFVQGEDLFFIMEYVRGQNLSRLLKSAGSLHWERAVPLLAGALEGIEQAHRAGIVHRDIKPDNLMITESGTVKVMDFGIARLIDGNSLTRTGLVIGTLRYMAPEQLRGEKVDRRTDVYALGTVLYEMVTGRLPFAGGSDYALLKAKIEGEPAPPSAAMPGLPAWLDQAVLTAMAQDPARRFQTVDELRLFLLHHGAAAARAAASGAAAPSADEPTLVKAVPGNHQVQPPVASPVPQAPLPATRAVAPPPVSQAPLPPTRTVAAPAVSTMTMPTAAAPTVAAPTVAAATVMAPAPAGTGPTRMAPIASSSGEIGVPFRSTARRRRLPLVVAALAVAAIAAVAILYRLLPSPLAPPGEPADQNAPGVGRAVSGSAAPGVNAPPPRGGSILTGMAGGPVGGAPPGGGGAGGIPGFPAGSVAPSGGAAGGTGIGPTPGSSAFPGTGGGAALGAGPAGGPAGPPPTAAAPAPGAPPPMVAPVPPVAARATMATPSSPPPAAERPPAGSKRAGRAAAVAATTAGTAAASPNRGPAGSAEEAPAQPAGRREAAGSAGEEAPAAAAPDRSGAGGGSEAGSGAEATGGGLPTEELGRIGAELDKESGDLRNLYADHLSRKEKGGSELTKTDDRLKDELKDFQNTAERFHSQFQPGFFARTRIRVGRISHGEDEHRQISRLAREMIDSGTRIDPLMAEARPDASVTQLWHRMRRQWQRVAELCGL